MKIIFVIFLGLVTLFTVDATLPLFEGTAVTSKPPIGTVLMPVLPTRCNCPWIDLMKCSDEWSFKWHSTGGYCGSSAITFNATTGNPIGLPTNVFAMTVVQSDLDGHYKSGSYALSFAGNGTVSVGGDANVSASSSGFMTFDVQPGTAGIIVMINSSSTNDPVRNLKLYLNDSASLDLSGFDPAWLSLANEFKVLSFSQWQREQFSSATPTWDWVNRTSSESFTQAVASGVSHEEILRLVQATQINPWVSVPYYATADYIEGMAALYASALPAGRTLYLTLSTWMGHTTDAAPWIARYKDIYAKFSSAFASKSNISIKLFINCNGVEVCMAVWIRYFEPLDALYDSALRTAVTGIAFPGRTMAGREPWTAENPNPWYLQYESYINDTKRITQEMMWLDELRVSTMIQRWALLDMPVVGFEGGIYMAVAMYGEDYLNPNTTQAELERTMQHNFRAYERSNDPQLRELWLEYLERWYRIGGGLLIAGQLVSPGFECYRHNTYVSGANRNNCDYRGLTRYIDVADSANKLTAVREFVNGSRSGWFLLQSQALDPPQTCAQCVHGNCIKGLCKCHAAFKGAACDTYDETQAPNYCSPDDYGANLNGLSDWSPVWMWTNFMNFAREWVFQPLNQVAPEVNGWIWAYGEEYPAPNPFPETDANGYPLRLRPNDAVSTFLRRDTYEYPHGTFHFFYDGEGTIKFAMDTHVHRRVRPGYVILETKPVRQMNNGLFFQIIRTNPDDPIRNIKVVPDSELATFQSQSFHPLFLRSMERYKVIRFMAVEHVGNDKAENNSVRTWASRTPPTYYSQVAGRDGMSIEYIVDLCNQLHIRPWIAIPYNADDEYVTQQARYIKAHLDSHLVPIVEYSNEVWATHHFVGFYAAEQGVNLGLAPGTDSVKARACFNQRRSREIWQTYANEGLNVTKVLGGQAVATRVLREALDCEPGAQPRPDYLTIAPYFGVDLWGPHGVYELDEVLPVARGAINSSAGWVADTKALADEYNVSGVVLYEAGPAFFGGAKAEDPDVVALGETVHSDPLMRTLVAEYFDALRKAGSSLQMYFTTPAGKWGRYGAWGIRPYQNQDPERSYKILGYEDYAKAHASCQWPTYPTSSCPDNCSGHGFCLADRCECYMGYRGLDCSEQWFIPDITQCNIYVCSVHNGTCEAQGIADDFYVMHTCVGCEEGWFGWQCQFPRCDHNCSWNGRCVAPNVCECYKGHNGTNCSIDCGCHGHGTCDSSSSCICDEGYTLKDGWCTPSCTCSNCLAPNVCDCQESCIYGGCWNGTCHCWAGYSGTTCDTLSSAPRPNMESPMGVNVAGVRDWSSTTEFLNLMARTREWFLNPARVYAPDSRWTVREPLELTKQGYPANIPFDRVAGTFATRDTEYFFKRGIYHVYYDGEGVLEFSYDASIIRDTQAKGYFQIDYRPSTILNNGMYIRVEATNPRNPIRNIRIYPDAYPHDEYAKQFVFFPEFLDEFKNFRAIRFSGWANLQNEFPDGPLSHNRTWANRKLPTAASQATGNGVSEDYMILLCNWVGASPWFTIPHDATDEYVESFAKFVQLRLRPDVPIYIEHSNEVWNGEFESWKYSRLMGERHGPSGISGHQAALWWHGTRSQQIFAIFRKVFGVTSRERLIFELGTQAVSTWVTSQILPRVSIRPLSLAVTVYFCGEPTFGGSIRAMQLSVAQLLDECEAVADANSTFDAIAANVEYARSQGLRIDAYEGGPGLVQYNVMFGGYPRPGTFELYESFTTNSRMREIVQKFFTKALQFGIVTNMYFSSARRNSKYGCWGIKESTAQACTSSPKCQGTMDWIEAHRDVKRARINWGLNEFGVDNVIQAEVAENTTSEMLDATARKLEEGAELSNGSITWVTAAQNSTETSRRYSNTLATKTIFFIVANDDPSKAAVEAVTANVLAAIKSSSEETIGLAISDAEIEPVTSVLRPNTDLPAELTPVPETFEPAALTTMAPISTTTTITTTTTTVLPNLPGSIDNPFRTGVGACEISIISLVAAFLCAM